MANPTQSLVWLLLQLVVRVTWDSGDVDQFVREAIDMWDTHRSGGRGHTQVGGRGCRVAE